MLVDSVAFPSLETALVGYATYAVWKDYCYRRGFRPSVKRGNDSMGYFYGAFGASTATLVAIPLTLETVAGFRVPFVLLNLAIPAYLCFFNAWFRNMLLACVCWVSEKVED
jgi:hypothetical protein